LTGSGTGTEILTRYGTGTSSEALEHRLILLLLVNDMGVSTTLQGYKINDQNYEIV